MSELYADIVFPAAPADRPTIYTNMVTTIDGRSVSGSRDQDVMDLGTKYDRQVMARLDAMSDAVLIGGRTLRASPRSWLPRARKHIVVSRSGDLPADARYFEGESYVASGNELALPEGVGLLQAGDGDLDWTALLKTLRQMGVEKMLVLGGSDINAQLLERDLVDELFLTVAPMIKMGVDVPTYADGPAFPRGALLNYKLMECVPVEDEVFLRYRRKDRS